MKSIHFEQALTPDGWRSDVSIDIDEGVITDIRLGSVARGEKHGIGLPGMPNLHSHAFQRGMAGLAETSSGGRDSFWTWRTAMYKLALSMSPDDVESIAAQLYVEMLEAGFTRVGEFHYLHHDPAGAPYANPAEMAERIAAASVKTGINLTLLPVMYRYAGFGALDPEEQQRRFVSTIDGFETLFVASERIVAGVEGGTIGVAPHSLRAVGSAELRSAVALASGRPIHIHVAEQIREVKDCIQATGRRPVEWLTEHASLDERWCLVHATHVSDYEAKCILSRGAIVGLCPITEANLGDGTFDVPRWLEHGGLFGIGSDSNVMVDVAGELRQLEYSQRLQRRERNVITPPIGSTGMALLEAALRGGAKALGQRAVGLSIGASADIVSLKEDHPVFAGHAPATILDAWIFAGGKDAVDCVWVRGVNHVEGGRHLRREAIARSFKATMQRLTS